MGQRNFLVRMWSGPVVRAAVPNPDVYERGIQAMGVRMGVTCPLAAALMMMGVVGVYGEEQANEPLKLGLLFDFSEGSTARAVDPSRAFDLAVKHLNAAGGVLGQPVEVAVGDSTRDPMVAVAVAEARRLVDDEGIHALVARIPAPIRSGRRAGDRAGRHPDHHPVRVVAAAYRGFRRRRSVSHRTLRQCTGPGPGASPASTASTTWA